MNRFFIFGFCILMVSFQDLQASQMLSKTNKYPALQLKQPPKLLSNDLQNQKSLNDEEFNSGMEKIYKYYRKELEKLYYEYDFDIALCNEALKRKYESKNVMLTEEKIANIKNDCYEKFKRDELNLRKFCKEKIKSLIKIHGHPENEYESCKQKLSDILKSLLPNSEKKYEPKREIQVVKNEARPSLLIPTNSVKDKINDGLVEKNNEQFVLNQILVKKKDFVMKKERRNALLPPIDRIIEENNDGFLPMQRPANGSKLQNDKSS